MRELNLLKDYPNELPIKKKSFSVLNDVPLSENERNSENLFKTTGIKLKYNTNKGITLKGFVGQQRYFFEYGEGIVRGLDGEIFLNQLRNV